MTPETIHCYCRRLALLLFFKGLKIILYVLHWCMSDLSKNVHANTKFNIQNVNISQVSIILNSCTPTLLTINLISVSLWDYVYCPLNLQLYIIYFSVVLLDVSVFYQSGTYIWGHYFHPSSIPVQATLLLSQLQEKYGERLMLKLRRKKESLNHQER